jgi:CheY-like chemotaxis protein
LVDLLVLPEERTSRSSQDLRKVLITAIQEMKPDRTNPPDSRDWRGFLILEQRFISGQTAAEVQQNLNISRSLLYQEQAYALDTLISRLWRMYLQNIELRDSAKAGFVPDVSQTPDTEILRLLADAKWEQVNINDLIKDLQPMLNVVAANINIVLEYKISTPVVLPAGNRVLVRMLLLGLIGDLGKCGMVDCLTIKTFKREGKMGLQFIAKSPVQDTQVDNSETGTRFSAETYNHIMRAMDGKIIVDIMNPCNRSLVWEDSSITKTLMIIDDHLEIVELFQRYLSGSPWRVVAAQSGELARDILSSVTPDVIFLDVILPHEDGWELLQAFRNEPQTSEIPIFVCSVILEPQLLETLGATGYLSKPVSQTDLYRVLRQLT